MQLNLLYIEDNPEDHFIMERSLKKNLPVPFKLVIAKTGQEGIENIKKNSFDIVFLDYRLPDMTGLDLLRELRRQSISKPIVFVTGKGNEEIAVEAMKLGAKDYITKDNILTRRMTECINEILLESSLPEGVDLEAAKEIYRILKENSSIKIEVSATPHSIPDSQIPISILLSSLMRMAEKGLLKKEPAHSSISCPSCSSLSMSVNVRCPDCGSRLIESGEALEHMTCGHVAFRSEFEKSITALICPKCNKELRMIGVDYRRIGNWYKCSYGHSFVAPSIIFTCKKCNKEFSLDQASLKPLYEFQLSEKGKETFRLSILSSEIARTL
ncbi:MAG: response regulator [Candidatus Bathyarchaeia archaeon]|nr:response regulator [Candidatus Bathyarchaeota archaeon]